MRLRLALCDADVFLDVQDVTNCCGGKTWRFVYDRMNFASWFSHVDEHGQRERFWARIADGDVVIDVGAACGSYTLPALARGAAHVYAFVPEQVGVLDPSAELMLLSLEANKWRGRCSILPFGLWSQTGWLVAHVHERMPEFFPPSVANVPDRAMPVTTLDDVETLKLDRLDWMKIDVEGAEVEVLRGALATLRRFRPRIIVENHLFKDVNMEAKVAAILEPLGYSATDRLTHIMQIVSHVLWESA